MWGKVCHYFFVANVQLCDSAKKNCSNFYLQAPGTCKILTDISCFVCFFTNYPNLFLIVLLNHDGSILVLLSDIHIAKKKLLTQTRWSQKKNFDTLEWATKKKQRNSTSRNGQMTAVWA